MVHWTPASVPAYAPVDHEIGDLLRSRRRDALAEVPYSEWYENSLRFPDSSVARHHREHYGTRPYAEFAREFEAALDQWDPDAWAAQFARTGARYVVFVAKHSDGYSLWPTEVRHPHRTQWNSTRDIVGEMAEAVRAHGMRFGLYYCSGFDWSFDDRPVGTMADAVASIPRGAYPAYAAAQVRELIARYRPSVLWGDVAWPDTAANLWPLFEEYYAAVPDGVVNDRFLPWHPILRGAHRPPLRQFIERTARRSAEEHGGLVPPAPPHFDHRTPEYTGFTQRQSRPWECVRGMDRSFAHNRASLPEHFIARDELFGLADRVRATGGNLLLNVGPRGEDAQIPPLQQLRLDWLAERQESSGQAKV